MVVADTGAIIALLDKGDRHHTALRQAYAVDPAGWILPWAILPEVDYLVANELGARAQRVWLDDVASGAFAVEWGADRDLLEANRFIERYGSLEMGLVDAVVMAMAERLRADVATLDLRHFGVVRFAHAPRLLPRDVQHARSRPPRR